jgi:hypothetical protein
MSTKASTGRVRSTYEFIKAHRGQYAVEPMCRVLGVAPSGYYEWLQRGWRIGADERSGLGSREQLATLVSSDFAQRPRGSDREVFVFRANKGARWLRGALRVTRSRAESTSDQLCAPYPRIGFNGRR